MRRKKAAGKGKKAFKKPASGPAAGAYSSGNGIQLYNLKNDPSEQNNVAMEHPEIVKELRELLGKVRAQGKSRP
jgi:hypothetical protein